MFKILFALKLLKYGFYTLKMQDIIFKEVVNAFWHFCKIPPPQRGGGAPAPIQNVGILLNKLCISSNILKGNNSEQNSQKISTVLARHHLQIFWASDAAASTQCNFCASWIGIALAILKQCLICIQIFGSLFFNVNMMAASVQQESASAVKSVDT